MRFATALRIVASVAHGRMVRRFKKVYVAVLRRRQDMVHYFGKGAAFNAQWMSCQVRPPIPSPGAGLVSRIPTVWTPRRAPAQLHPGHDKIFAARTTPPTTAANAAMSISVTMTMNLVMSQFGIAAAAAARRRRRRCRPTRSNRRFPSTSFIAQYAPQFPNGAHFALRQVVPSLFPVIDQASLMPADVASQLFRIPLRSLLNRARRVVFQ